MNQLFRENALKNLSPTEHIQDALIIIKPSAWLAVSCALFFLAGLGVWAVWVKIEMTIPAIGIVVAESKFDQAESLWRESIKEHADKMVTLQNLFMQQQDLYRKGYLTIMELEKAREAYLTAKEELSVISRQALFKPTFDTLGSKQQTLDALVFVAHAQGKKIVVGMDSYILPDTTSIFESSYIKGKVISVSEFPVTREAVYSYLGNMALVDEFFGGSVPFMVRVRLVEPVGVEPGATVTGKIVNRRGAVWELLKAR